MPIAEISGLVAMLRKNLANPPGSIAEFRERFEAMSGLFTPLEGVKREPVDMMGVPGVFFTAPNASTETAILYLHGGGYVIGSVESYSVLMSELSAASGARVLGVEYRLAPENRFPAGLDDCFSAYTWLLERIDASKVVIGGDSAGGGLTMALLLRIREAALPMPAGAFLISPWVDLSASGQSMETKAEEDPMVQRMGTLACAHMYTGGKDMENPLASPLWAELSSLPPLLIQVGTAETLLDDSIRLAKRAEEACVAVELEVWEEMIHVWHLFSGQLAEGKEAIGKIGAFVLARTGL